MRIAILSCTKAKQNYPCPAKELYSKSIYFQKAYRYAKASCDKIYILSPKYNLVEEDQLLEPYEMSLKDMTLEEKAAWSKRVFLQLSQRENIKESTFVIITGKDYYRDFYKRLPHCELPIRGLKYGELLARLDTLYENVKSGQ